MYRANLGTLHPRMKKPLGKRLAAGLHATAYNGTMPAGGPVLGGCSVAGKALTLKFNVELLKGQGVLFNTSSTVALEDTALYVLVNDSAFETDWANTIIANHEVSTCTNYLSVVYT